MVTPTGMSLVAALGEPLAAGTSFVPENVGYGAGARESSVLRLVLGRVPSRADHSPSWDDVAVLKVHVDDVTGERIAFAMQTLMAEGALDVTATPCLMKKGRPATAIEVMVPPADAVRFGQRVLELTRSLGVRVSTVRRLVLPRRVVEVSCAFGPIRVKTSALGPRPEYEDCAAAARAHGVDLGMVVSAALQAFASQEDADS